MRSTNLNIPKCIIFTKYTYVLQIDYLVMKMNQGILPNNVIND